MVKPTAYTEDVEMKWTQSDQEAVEATYSQEFAGAAGRAGLGQMSAGTSGQEEFLEQQEGFHRLDEIEMDAWRSFLAASTSVTSTASSKRAAASPCTSTRS